MKTTFSVWLVSVLVTFVGGCGSSGTASLADRCESWCERRNMDAECGQPITSCPASCLSIILSAGAECEAEAEVLFTCLNAAADICPTQGVQVCTPENNALVVCTNNRSMDAGPVPQ